MNQQQNVQRGLLFTFFMYSVITFVFYVIKLIMNRVDKEAIAGVEQGNKYEQDKEVKSREKDEGESKSKIKKKQQNMSEGQGTMQNLEVKNAKDKKPEQNESKIVVLSLKLRHHIHHHLPFFFPFALNIITGTSQSFLFVLFFFVQVSFALFNDLKIHNNCVQNRIIKVILQNIGYVLTFFAWANLWGVSTSQMVYAIKKG